MEIYTDGSCMPNPGPMGAAYVIIKNNSIIHEDNFYKPKGTNNEGEYLAIQKALEYYFNVYTENVILYSDSNLAIQQLNNNWKVKDPKLIYYYNSIKLLIKNKNITFRHVKAHNGNKWNEYVDKKAKEFKDIQVHNNKMSDSTSDIISKLLDEKLKPLLDMQQQLIDQNLKLSEQLNRETSIKPPKLTRSTNMPVYNNKENVTLLKNEEGIFYVTGNTFPIKDEIKKIGAMFNDNRQQKVWSFNPGVTVEQITESLSSKCTLENKIPE